MLRCIAMSVSRWEINHTKTKLSLYSLCFVFGIEFMFLIIVVHFALFRSFSQRHDAVKRSYCWRKKKTSRSDQNRNQSTSFRYFTVSLSISFFLSFLLLLFFLLLLYFHFHLLPYWECWEHFPLWFDKFTKEKRKTKPSKNWKRPKLESIRKG